MAKDTLPENEAKELRRLRDAEDLTGLRQRVLALRRAGWTLRAIGEPLDAGRSTARMWELGADPNKSLPKVTKAPARNAGERVIRLRIDVPEDELPELKRLAASARRVRGWTPKQAQTRQDADALDELLEMYVKRGVPVKRLATRLGYTYRAIAARLERRAEKRALDAA